MRTFYKYLAISFSTLFVFCVFGFANSAEAATTIYRSASPSATTALSTSTASNVTLTISGTTATFSSVQPTNVGVGDAIQYDSDSNGSIDAIAFIHARTSGTVYSIRNAAGGTPTAVSSDTDWSIFRAYTSLANAETGTENTSIADAVENFDSWTGGKVLTGSDEQWNIALYANGSTGDGVVSFDGWTTDATRYLNIYTPTSPNEVGISQRHSGIWDDTKYKIEITASQSVNIADNYVKISGIQINQGATTGSQSIISFGSGAANSSVSSNILKSAIHPASGSITGISIANNNGSLLYIYNNLIYNLITAGTSATRGIADTSASGSYSYVYNNTFHTCSTGTGSTTAISMGLSGRATVKNNLINNCAEGILGTYAAGSDYNSTNASSLTYSVTGGGNTHDRVAQTFSFVNAGAQNYHLASSDTGAKDVGVNLSADSGFAFNTDIDGQARSFGSGWDIGADEYYDPDVTAPTRTNGLPTGTQSFGTTQVTLSLDTDENATCKYGTSSSTAYASIANTFSATGGTNHTQLLTGISNGQSFEYYVRCSDSVGNVNTNDYTISFSTQGSDTSGPDVSITSPLNNSFASSSTITLTATATDTGGVAGVQFKLDTSTNIGSEDTGTPFTINWDPSAVSEGSHSIIAVARDNAGNYSTSSSITVVVDRTAPVVDITSPLSGTVYDYTPINFYVSATSTTQCSVNNTSWTDCRSEMISFGQINGYKNITTGNTFTLYVRTIDSAGNVGIDSVTGLTKGVWQYPRGIPNAGLWGSVDPMRTAAPSMPGNWPSSAQSGYYYVDSSHPQATDTSNTNGYPDKPRLTIPTTLSAGSYVMVAHVNSLSLLTVNGTSNSPVWIVGTSTALVQPEQTGTHLAITTGSSYLIVDGLTFDGTNTPDTSASVAWSIQGSNHIAIRNSVVRNMVAGYYNPSRFQSGGAAAWYSGLTSIGASDGNTSDVVIYNNRIVGNAGGQDLDYENGRHAIIASGDSDNIYRVERVWIVDNILADNPEDAIQLGQTSVSADQTLARNFYIARNQLNNNGENAIDLKATQNIIISENNMKGYKRTNYRLGAVSGSDGSPGVINDDGNGPLSSFWLFNTIHSSRAGIRNQAGGGNQYLYGNLFYDLNIEPDRGDTEPSSVGDAGGVAYWQSSGSNVFMLNNTIYDVHGGIYLLNVPSATIANNIVAEISDHTQGWPINIQNATEINVAKNIYFDSNGNVRQDANALSSTDVLNTNPQLINGPSYDFNLNSGSVAIDNASSTPVTAFIDMFNGLFGVNLAVDIASTSRPQDANWDIGAYEFVSGAPDTNAPSISGGQPSGTLSNGTTMATLQVLTNENATCKYGTVASTAYASIANTFSTTGGTIHSQSLTGLTSGNSYTYYVRCVDGATNTNTSDYIVSFSVAAPSDSAAPTVSLTVPVNSSVVSGSSVTISANASDNIGVAGVQFKYDTTNNIGIEDTSNPYSITWDTTLVPDGSHTIVAVARDAAGNNTTSAGRTIIVDNTAPIRSNGSPSGTLSAGTTNTTISLTTNENAACAYSTNPGTAYGSMIPFSSTNNTSHSDSVSGLSNGGSYVYYVRCIDTQGNTNSTDFAISFTVASSIGAPTAIITSPVNNQIVSGSSVILAADADDDVSISGVKFRLDDITEIGSEDTGVPFSVIWDSRTVSDGVHTLVAVARDGSDNFGTSSVVTITVDNTAPIIQTGLPSGTLALDTTTTLLQIVTNENATCKYGTSPSTDYSSITNVFSTTGGTLHTQPISGLNNGSAYSYYVRCSDGRSVVNTSDYAILFSVTPAPSSGGGGGGGGGSSGGSVVILYPTATTTTSVNGATTTVAVNTQETICPQGHLFSTITGKKCTSWTTTATTPAAGYFFTRNLTLGATGADVKALQIFLNSNGFTVSTSGIGSSGNESTYFGGATRSALAKFQTSKGITPAAGYFGPATRAVVNGTASAPTATTPTITPPTSIGISLKLGSSGPAVKLMRTTLRALGYFAPYGSASDVPASASVETDYFGSTTEAALKKFQCDKGIVCDGNAATTGWGVLGPRTRGVLGI